jgi:hypothetical protein
MPVKIELYATASKTYPLKPSQLLYSASSVANDWSCDAFVTGAIGVKDIPWQEISQPSPSDNQKYGIIFVTITLPNGKAFSARYDEAKIAKP